MGRTAEEGAVAAGTRIRWGLRFAPEGYPTHLEIAASMGLYLRLQCEIMPFLARNLTVTPGQASHPATLLPRVPMTTKLLIADHRPLIRTGLSSFLSGTKINVVAEAASSQAAIQLARKHKPDVLLLGRVAEENIPASLKTVRSPWPNLPVIVFGPDDNLTYLARSRALGACGYLAERCQQDELLSAIRAAATGQDAWMKEQLDRISGAPTIPAGMNISLTPRERQVLRQIAFGLPNKEIALLLGISIETVKEHVQNILRKLKVPDRTKAAVWAVRNGLG